MSRHRTPAAVPPDETPDQLRARLRRFALATRDEVRRAATIPFPEHISVLTGPLRRVRSGRKHRDASLPEMPARSAMLGDDGDAS
jgi:hypothetical protein